MLTKVHNRMISGAAVNVADFGAVGDGVVDDTTAIQAAVSYATSINSTVELMTAHVISSTILITAPIVIGGSRSYTNITASFVGPVFQSSASYCYIKNLNVSGGASFFKQTASFEDIFIHNVDWSAAADTLNRHFFYTDLTTMTGEILRIESCEALNGVPIYMDNCSVDDIYVTENIFNNPCQFVFRNLDQLSTGASNNVYFERNWVFSINGNLTDKSTTARCLQVECDNVLYVRDNILNGAESTTASNFIYFLKCSLVCSGNDISSIKGTSTTSVIDDKGQTVGDEDFVIISNNSFDQTIVALADSPEAMIRINEKRNVSVHNNKFRSLRCFPCRFYHSSDTGRYPENLSFSDNEIFDQKHPVACQVFQTIKNIAIKGNKIYSIKNPDSISVNGRTIPRIADVYVSFNNGVNLDGVQIEGNVVFETDSAAAIMTIYRNAAAVTSNILNVSVVNNELKGGGGAGGCLVHFTSATMAAVDIINNIGPAGIAATVGTEPAGNRKVNNVIT